jgi:hypothetical protein
VCADDVIAAIGRLPDKLSAIDPTLTLVLTIVTDLVSTFVAELFYRSIAAGQVVRCFKQAYIISVAIKAGLDNTDSSSYQPISNL